MLPTDPYSESPPPSHPPNVALRTSGCPLGQDGRRQDEGCCAKMAATAKRGATTGLIRRPPFQDGGHHQEGCRVKMAAMTRWLPPAR